VDDRRCTSRLKDVSTSTIEQVSSPVPVSARSVCVFCGSNAGLRSEYVEAARQLGRLIASLGLTLVYGGGKVGLMGALADAALANGGRAVGVMPQALVDKEIAHRGLTELHVVGSMHERKARMEELADAFLLLPGGFGSWEEFFEIVTWAQLGLHRKPFGVLNTAGYYDHFLAMADRATEDAFVRQSHRSMIIVDTVPERLMERLSTGQVPVEPKWIEAGER
jgi:uncharacterized protein (TIGR00730 family)